MVALSRGGVDVFLRAHVETDGGNASFVLLLLDYWPLRSPGIRRSNRFPGVALLRKFPCWRFRLRCVRITVLAQHEAVSPLPLSLRLSERVRISMSSICGKCFIPTGLVVSIHFPKVVCLTWKSFWAGCLLLAISTTVFSVRRKSSLAAVRLAVVSGNAGTGDWCFAGRRASTRRSIHLSSANWTLHRVDLEPRRIHYPASLISIGTKRCVDSCRSRTRSLRAQSNCVLAKQPHFVGPRPGIYFRQYCRAKQSRQCAVGRRKSGRSHPSF